MEQDVQTKFDELSRRIAAVENAVPVSPSSIDRLTSTIDKHVIEDAVSDAVLDIVWDNYIYITPFFADDARFLIPAGALGNFGNTSTGYVVQAGAGTFDSATLGIEPSVLKFERETRFRVVAEVDDASDINAYIFTLGQGSNEFGFLFDNGTLKGYIVTAGGTVTKTLQTYSVNTPYELEFRYYPGGKVVYYVNTIEKGTLTMPTDVGATGSSNITLIGMYVSSVAAATVTLYTSYVEIIQKKK